MVKPLNPQTPKLSSIPTPDVPDPKNQDEGFQIGASAGLVPCDPCVLVYELWFRVLGF